MYTFLIKRKPIIVKSIIIAFTLLIFLIINVSFKIYHKKIDNIFLPDNKSVIPEQFVE